jgi:hypothetical protein
LEADGECGDPLGVCFSAVLPQPLASVATATAAATPRIILRTNVVDMATSVL